MGRAPLRAQDFMANNPEHLELLRRMGVSLIHLKDGRVQLVQHATQVNTHSHTHAGNLPTHSHHADKYSLTHVTHPPTPRR